MRNFILLLISLNLIISCTEDKLENEQQITNFPTNISLSAQSAEVGEVVTINGNGFLVNETYIVTFTDNITANITEINNNFLKVKIPENAISGNITLTYKNETNTIGNITIEEVNTSETYIYNETANKLAKLNIKDGVLTYVADFISNGTTVGAIINKQNNEYISFRNNTDPNFVRVNLTNGEVKYQVVTSNLAGNDVFSGLTIDNNGEVYIYNETVNKLAKLNIENGELTYVNNFATGGTNVGAVYHSANNEYISFENNTDPNFVRVNLTNREVKYQVVTANLVGNDIFSGLTIDVGN